MPETEIDKIVKTLKANKAKDLKPYLDKLKKKTRLKPIDQDELLKREQTEEKIKTGTLIDDIIGGGLPPSSKDAVTSLLLYGEYGSGKTQTCFTMAVESPDDVIYIDTEGSYRAERIQEICEDRGKDWNEVKKKIHLFRPVNWVEQMMILYSLPAPTDTHTGKIGLIIIDSLTKEFRGIEFAGRASLTVKQPLLREFVFSIEDTAKTLKCAIIFTTQIYESPQANPFLPTWAGHKAVGGASVLHQPAFVIFFRRGSGNLRVARMMDSSWKPLKERPFAITKKGIVDIPKDAKAAEKLLKKADEFTKKQEQELLKEKKPKEPQEDEASVP